MITLFKSFLFVYLLLATALSQAQECMERTWKGTLGRASITMEFGTLNLDNAPAGRYHYGLNLQDLLLVREDAVAGRWKEIDLDGNVSGYLTLSCAGDSLTGTWQSPDGVRKLPVNVKVNTKQAYSTARLDALKPAVVERKTIGAFSYELLRVKQMPSVTGVRLIGNTPEIAKINKKLFDDFWSSVNEDIGCRELGFATRGQQHGYGGFLAQSVVTWNGKFVVIRKDEAHSCGGVHPSGGTTGFTYDLFTAQAEDVSAWLKEGYRNEIARDSELGILILKHYGATRGPLGGCREIVKLSGAAPWPTGAGMAFLTWATYADSACIKDVVVPYKQIAPFLSPEGKIRTQSFLVK